MLKKFEDYVNEANSDVVDPKKANNSAKLIAFNTKIGDNGKVIFKGKALDVWHHLINKVGFVGTIKNNKYVRATFNEVYDIANSNKNKWTILTPEKAGNSEDKIAKYMQDGGTYYALQLN